MTLVSSKTLTDKVKDVDGELVEDIKRRMILHWNYRNLRELPKELLDYGEHIREIYLKRNSIIKLPENVGQLHNLTNFYLAANKLTELPTQIEHLQNLVVLDVSQNDLTTLPSSIGKLKRLEKLMLTQNQINFLPPEMKKLKNLKFLELSNNQLRVLSDDIVSGWESLEEIGMDRNPMNFLPKKLTSLHNLRIVSACKCNLKCLPSMPFYSLVHGIACRRGERPRCFDQHANNIDDDEPGFQFRFDGNENLNCIPYWLLQLIGPRLDSFGCGIDEENGEDALACDFPHVSFYANVVHGTSNNILAKKRINIYFDPTIRQIETLRNCSSLLELCLRYLYRNQGVETQEAKEKRFAEDLPNNLKSLLLGGPVSHCFQCMSPIFTQVCPVIFTLILPPVVAGHHPGGGVFHDYNANVMRNGGAHLKYGCILFCNFFCKQIFIKNDVSKSNLHYQDISFIKENEISLD